MSRIRTIKPAFFLDEDLVALEPRLRLFFIGLWTLSDKLGRFEDRPMWIKAQIFPYERVNIEAMLATLHPRFITRYKVNGKPYIQINTFTKHQRPHHTESGSNIPEPNGEITVKQPLSNGPGTVSSRQEGKGKDKGKDTGKGGESEFEALWKEYPRQDGYKEAFKHFRATVKTTQDLTDITIALGNYKAHLTEKRIEPKFIKNGSTWFNNWKDWVEYKEIIDLQVQRPDL